MTGLLPSKSRAELCAFDETQILYIKRSILLAPAHKNTGYAYRQYLCSQAAYKQPEAVGFGDLRKNEKRKEIPS